jgi:hypothetical protein
MNLFALLKGIAKKDEQLTTFQANETRLVTKVRWVIEDDNGETKQSFRALDGVIQNTMLPHIIQDYKIASSLKNCFFSSKLSDAEDSIEIADEIELMFQN